MAATVVILLTPYLVGQGVAFTLTAQTRPPGIKMWLEYFALGLFVWILPITIGWLIGKVFTSGFAALTASLTCLVLLGMMNSARGAVVVSGRPELTVNLTSVALRLILIAILLVAILFLPAYGQMRARKKTIILPGITIATLVGLMSTSQVIVDRPPAGSNVICIEGATNLCLWPEHKKYAPVLRDFNARIADLPAAFVVPSRINQHGIESSGHEVRDGQDFYTESANQAPTFYILEGSVWSPAGDISNAILSETFKLKDQQKCRWASLQEADKDNARLSALGSWLETYLAGGGVPDYSTNAPKGLQESWAVGRSMANDFPVTQQFRWAQQEVKDLYERNCDA